MGEHQEPSALDSLPRTFRPFDPSKDGSKVAICICNNHAFMPDNYFWTYQRMLKPSGSHAFKGEASTKCGSLNEATAKALQFGAEWLFFTDIDMTFPIDALKRLLSHNLPIVSGLYHIATVPYAPVAGWVKPDPDVPCGYKFLNQNGNLWRYDYAKFPSGLVEVDWVGAGCLLIHRDVIKDIGWPAWADKWKEGMGQRIMGHDTNLCLRAKEKGYKVFVDSDVNCGHWRMQEVEKTFAEAMYASDFASKVVGASARSAAEAPYWNELWLREKITSHARAPFYGAEHDYILGLIPKRSNLIDFGCGPGEFMARAWKERSCKCAGVDFSAEAIEAVAKMDFQGIRADLRTYEANGQSFTFDVAVSNHVVEHVEDDDRLVWLMAQHVRLGGLVIASVPVATDPDGPAALEHVRSYTAESLGELFAKNLTDVTVTRHGHSYVAIGTKS